MASHRGPAQPIAFFSGVQNDTVVALTGSPHHVIGNPASTELQHGMASYGIVFPEEDSDHLQLAEPEELDARYGGSTRAWYAYERADEYARKATGPVQRLEFMARTLGAADRQSYYDDPLGDVSRLVLGSPLFVAMTRPRDVARQRDADRRRGDAHGSTPYRPGASRSWRRAVVDSFGVAELYPVIKDGAEYARQTSILGGPFTIRAEGELAAWSYIRADEEELCVMNMHVSEARGADVIVDASLNPPGAAFTVVHVGGETSGGLGVGSVLRVRWTADGAAYLELRNIPSLQFVVLTNGSAVQPES
jgi:hypothetical protein